MVWLYKITLWGRGLDLESDVLRRGIRYFQGGLRWLTL